MASRLKASSSAILTTVSRVGVPPYLAPQAWAARTIARSIISLWFLKYSWVEPDAAIMALATLSALLMGSPSRGFHFHEARSEVSKAKTGRPRWRA